MINPTKTPQALCFSNDALSDGTHDSRKNEHCAVEEKKAKTISKLWENSLKTSYYHPTLFLLYTFFARERDGGRGYLLRAYISLKSNPTDSARGLAVSNLRERKGCKSKIFFYISRDNMGAELKKKKDKWLWIQENFFQYLIDG